ncbi:hypothetical protein [Wolbachia endosymbiont (group E) of Neria commutata]|uniref:hypothetical protein n=1 Tax=Wolbachia endosymbiont (group E) of Neria commutata TaxID=3066149 RepID=UPI003132E53B
MLSLEVKKELLGYINDKGFRAAVSCIDEFLQESSDEGIKAQRIEEIKNFISGEGFIQALKGR